MDENPDESQIDITELRYDLLELAIDFHTRQGDNRTSVEIVATAKVFEEYLVVTPPLDQNKKKDENDESNYRNDKLLN